MTEFLAFPKMARLYSECTITEKIDGTNACVIVSENGEVSAQSRSRLLTVENDNFGFARWVAEHPELADLGPGHHFGEWWGLGIQRGYEQDRKRFSLFNVARWAEDRPACCDVVPTLWTGEFTQAPLAVIEEDLRVRGSFAALGFMKPEGFVIFHHRLNAYLKHPFDKAAEKP